MSCEWEQLKKTCSGEGEKKWGVVLSGLEQNERKNKKKKLPCARSVLGLSQKKRRKKKSYVQQSHVSLCVFSFPLTPYFFLPSVLK